jgi:hypothetical protein
MIGKAAAGIAALGLIGGVGHVVYDNNGAKVTITDHGKSKSVHIATSDEQTYTCPDSASREVKQHMIRLGRIKLTVQQVRREYRQLGEQDYRYSGLVGRAVRLVRAYNAEVNATNAILGRDCEANDA